ncbi:unnamed protein product [Clavelina lepadiformis]|uniref:Uncharacterized protein n=1 Tax=Clavelina lepadiformis TaxID=159417 RepID=A0ABP0GD87_CLALP
MEVTSSDSAEKKCDSVGWVCGELKVLPCLSQRKLLSKSLQICRSETPGDTPVHYTNYNHTKRGFNTPFNYKKFVEVNNIPNI